MCVVLSRQHKNPPNRTKQKQAIRGIQKTLPGTDDAMVEGAEADGTLNEELRTPVNPWRRSENAGMMVVHTLQCFCASGVVVASHVLAHLISTMAL